MDIDIYNKTMAFYEGLICIYIFYTGHSGGIYTDVRYTRRMLSYIIYKGMPQPEKRVKIIISLYIIKATVAEINPKHETTVNYLVFSVFLLFSYRLQLYQKYCFEQKCICVNFCHGNCFLVAFVQQQPSGISSTHKKYTF